MARLLTDRMWEQARAVSRHVQPPFIFRAAGPTGAFCVMLQWEIECPRDVPRLTIDAATMRELANKLPLAALEDAQPSAGGRLWRHQQLRRPDSFDDGDSSALVRSGAGARAGAGRHANGTRIVMEYVQPGTGRRRCFAFTVWIGCAKAQTSTPTLRISADVQDALVALLTDTPWSPSAAAGDDELLDDDATGADDDGDGYRSYFRKFM